MYNLIKGLALFVALLVLSTGCGKDFGGGQSDLHRGDYSRLAAQYNELLAKQKSLINSSHALQLQAEKENVLLLALDAELVRLSTSIEAFYDAIPADRALTKVEDDIAVQNLAKVVAAHKKALEALVSIEAVILAEQAALYANAEHVYKEPKPNREAIAAQERIFRDRAMQLLGVRNLMAVSFTQISRYAKTLKISGPLPTVIPERRVELNDRDKEVNRAVVDAKASGFARGTKGEILPLSNRDAIVRHATANGFNAEAAGDGASMAARTGGVVAFASSDSDIPKTVIDVLAHIKPQLNTNTDDLELALVIDYSGSMSNKIKATLQGLKDVVESLKNVVASGRNVRVALVTFGEPGKEKVELDLTRNMAVVQQELDRLYREYEKNQHSTDPGEASIHGLEIAAKKVSWKSKNRMAIAITDEPSQEIQLKQTKYVDEVFEALRAGGIQSRIYTIVVK